MAPERTVAFRPGEARGCEHCGFAYLFELLDDYYPAPNAAFFACDADGRIVDCGKGSFELTGMTTEKAIGQPIAGHANGDLPARAVADIFPAYDDEEGGVLVVLTPANGR
jgi:hypothetical protein